MKKATVCLRALGLESDKLHGQTFHRVGLTQITGFVDFQDYQVLCELKHGPGNYEGAIY